MEFTYEEALTRLSITVLPELWKIVILIHMTFLIKGSHCLSSSRGNLVWFCRSGVEVICKLRKGIKIDQNNLPLRDLRSWKQIRACVRKSWPFQLLVPDCNQFTPRDESFRPSLQFHGSCSCLVDERLQLFHNHNKLVLVYICGQWWKKLNQ